MKLFYIQDPDRPVHVIAESWGQALEKWRSLVEKENPDVPSNEIDDPEGIKLVCYPEDLIL